MKMIRIALLAMCLLSSPSLAAQYQGKTIDGRKLSARVYSYETGGVYAAQVQFDRDQAEILFAGGSQLKLKLRQSEITNLQQIEGYGRFGQIPLGRFFSLGLHQGGSIQPLQGFWSIRLDPANFPSNSGQP